MLVIAAASGSPKIRVGVREREKFVWRIAEFVFTVLEIRGASERFVVLRRKV
jgi:hypothetical protein